MTGSPKSYGVGGVFWWGVRRPVCWPSVGAEGAVAAVSENRSVLCVFAGRLFCQDRDGSAFVIICSV